jgi:hypothetical protein
MASRIDPHRVVFQGVLQKCRILRFARPASANFAVDSRFFRAPGARSHAIVIGCARKAALSAVCFGNPALALTPPRRRQTLRFRSSKRLDGYARFRLESGLRSNIGRGGAFA